MAAASPSQTSVTVNPPSGNLAAMCVTFLAGSTTSFEKPCLPALKGSFLELESAGPAPHERCRQ